jgi:hypothetical protein
LPQDSLLSGGKKRSGKGVPGLACTTDNLRRFSLTPDDALVGLVEIAAIAFNQFLPRSSAFINSVF